MNKEVDQNQYICIGDSLIGPQLGAGLTRGLEPHQNVSSRIRIIASDCVSIPAGA